MQVLKAHFGDGSSPLTRGKLECDVSEGIGRGIIPAHAGKTYDGLIPALRSGDHPRSRGENNVAWHDPATPTGSSPLTRGKQTPAIPGFLSPGIIPAHAGKTMRSGQHRMRCRDHPRSRGENAAHAACSFGTTGSSPLTRGKQRRRRLQLEGQRIIPAHAGKTRWHVVSRIPTADHPRSRGENCACCFL